MVKTTLWVLGLAFGQELNSTFHCSDCADCCIDQEHCGSSDECSQKYTLTLIISIALVCAGLLLFVYFQTGGNNDCCDIDCLRRTFKVKDIEHQHHFGPEEDFVVIEPIPDPQESEPATFKNPTVDVEAAENLSPPATGRITTRT